MMKPDSDREREGKPRHPVSGLQSQDSRLPAPASDSRRRLLNVLMGASLFAWLGSVIYPMVSFLFPPKGSSIEVDNVLVGKESDFPNNSGTNFRIGNKPGLLIRTASGEFRAYNATCTHLDCTVQFKKDDGIIWCACHNGRYNLKGINIGGPPPRPLTPLTVSLKGGDVYVSRAG